MLCDERKHLRIHKAGIKGHLRGNTADLHLMEPAGSDELRKRCSTCPHARHSVPGRNSSTVVADEGRELVLIRRSGYRRLVASQQKHSFLVACYRWLYSRRGVSKALVKNRLALITTI